MSEFSSKQWLFNSIRVDSDLWWKQGGGPAAVLNTCAGYHEEVEGCCFYHRHNHIHLFCWFFFNKPTPSTKISKKMKGKLKPPGLRVASGNCCCQKWVPENQLRPIHSWIQPKAHWPCTVHPSIHPSIYSCIYSSVHPHIQSSIHLSIQHYNMSKWGLPYSILVELWQRNSMIELHLVISW